MPLSAENAVSSEKYAHHEDKFLLPLPSELNKFLYHPIRQFDKFPYPSTLLGMEHDM